MIGFGAYFYSSGTFDGNVYGVSVTLAMALIGAVIVLVSFIGCCSALKRVRWLLLVYAVIQALLIVALGVLLVIALLKYPDTPVLVSELWSNSDSNVQNEIKNNLNCLDAASCTSALTGFIQQTLLWTSIISGACGVLTIFGLMGTIIILLDDDKKERPSQIYERLHNRRYDG